MAKGVNLLSYWMPVLRQLKEFKEIAKAEEPELLAILEACDTTLKNFFITTADEQGISQYESLLGIFPLEGADLESRRLAVLTKWATKEVYTDKWLYDKLLSLCGSENLFNIDSHYDKYALDLTVKIGIVGVLEILNEMLIDVIPCNLVYTLKQVLEEQSKTTVSVGVAVSTAMNYQIITTVA